MTEDSTDLMHGVSIDSAVESVTESGRTSQTNGTPGSKYALLKKESLESIRAKYKDIRATTKTASGIVEEFTRRFSSDLDELLAQIDAVLDDIRDEKRGEFSDAELHRLAIRLPVLLYRLGDGLDHAALESDISKAVLAQVSSMNYLNAPGKTIPEKKSYAEIATADETCIVDLTKHVHARLKSKAVNAELVFDGLRKVLGSRDTEKQIFGRKK